MFWWMILRLPLLALLLLALAAVSGCSADSKEHGTTTDSATFHDTTSMQNSPPVSGSGSAAQQGAMVNVTLSDFKIDMPPSIPAGPTNFVVRNNGNSAHNFKIEGGSMNEQLPADLMSGEVRTLHVDMAPGTYTIYCPVRDHKDKGMKMQLTVTAAAPAGR
jgi:uncharacterized cupredoxin-like copper-binding protein